MMWGSSRGEVEGYPALEWKELPRLQSQQGLCRGKDLESTAVLDCASVKWGDGRSLQCSASSAVHRQVAQARAGGTQVLCVCVCTMNRCPGSCHTWQALGSDSCFGREETSKFRRYSCPSYGSFLKPNLSNKLV